MADAFAARLAAARRRGAPRSPRRTIYNMCTQKPPYDYSENLYQRYRETFNTYLSERVRAPRAAPSRAAAAPPP